MYSRPSCARYREKIINQYGLDSTWQRPSCVLPALAHRAGRGRCVALRCVACACVRACARVCVFVCRATHLGRVGPQPLVVLDPPPPAAMRGRAPASCVCVCTRARTRAARGLIGGCVRACVRACVLARARVYVCARARRVCTCVHVGMFVRASMCVRGGGGGTGRAERQRRAWGRAGHARPATRWKPAGGCPGRTATAAWPTTPLTTRTLSSSSSSPSPSSSSSHRSDGSVARHAS